MEGVFLMTRESKVSLDDKLKAVEDYLDGVQSVKQIAITLQVNRSSIKEWITKYRQYGTTGLKTLPKTPIILGNLKPKRFMNTLKEKPLLGKMH